MLTISKTPKSLHNAASHTLHAKVTPDTALRVRRQYLLAQLGDITLTHDYQDAESELAEAVKDKRAWTGARDLDMIRALGKRLKPEVSVGALTAGHLFMHKAQGSGDIYLGTKGGDVSVFALNEESVTFYRQAEVLAYTDNLTAELSETVGKELGVVLGELHAWTLTGTGEIATATSGEVIVLPVTQDTPVLVEGEALMASTTGVSISTTGDYAGRLTMRAVAEIAKHVPNGFDLGRQKVWVSAEGEGTIIVRSSD